MKHGERLGLCMRPKNRVERVEDGLRWFRMV